METKETSHIDVFEISVVVPDRDKAVQQFRDRLGLEPYFMAEGPVAGVVLHGKEVPPFNAKMAFYHAGGACRLELLEAEGGIYAEYIKKHGPGVNHIACRVSDADFERDWFEKRGVGTVETIDNPMGKWVYLDTEPIMGFYLELVQSHLREPGMER